MPPKKTKPTAKRDPVNINSAAAALGRRGGKARVNKQTPEQRSQSAKNASLARWKKARNAAAAPVSPPVAKPKKSGGGGD